MSWSWLRVCWHSCLDASGVRSGAGREEEGCSFVVTALSWYGRMKKILNNDIRKYLVLWQCRGHQIVQVVGVSLLGDHQGQLQEFPLESSQDCFVECSLPSSHYCRLNHSGAGGMSLCNECGKPFSYTHDLEKHIKKVHLLMYKWGGSSECWI